MNSRTNWLVLALATLSMAPAWAQAQGDGTAAADHCRHHTGESASTAAPASGPAAMQGMDHGGMKMHGGPAPAPAAMQGMDHGNMKKHSGAAPAAMQGMDHGGMKMHSSPAPAATQGLDHDGDMKMNSGPAPADARDPHGYSGGYALGTGTYALAATRQLRLADEDRFGSLLVDRLERAHSRDSNSTVYDARASFGRDYDRLVIKAEGDVRDGKLQEARTELLWGHAVSTFWDIQAGLRYDSGAGPDRSWLALGVQGLAPYWFDVDATAYLGNSGRTALRLGAEYEILLTQKLILQPRVEASLHGKDDEARGIGSGLSDIAAGLRLRYEISRQIAPYLGVERDGKFGKTADLARAAGERKQETRWVAGVRFWF